MQNPSVELTVQQLKRAVEIKQKIESLEAELAALLGGGMSEKRGPTKRGRGGPSKASAASPASKTAPKRKWTLTPEARAKLSAIAKARWRKAKAQGRSRL